MKLTVLGSGSTVPHPRRSSSAYWLETSGGNILLDCSATAPHRMAACSVDWPNLDAIWISHFHMDHVGGLGPLFAATKHAPEMQGRTRPLRIYGPEGIERLLDSFSEVNDYKLRKQPFPVELVEVESLEQFEIVSGIDAVAMKTKHTDESHAIHIRDGEATLMYSADTGFDEKVATFGTNASLMLIECSFVHEKPNEKHLVLSEAIHLIRKAKARRAMLTHFYPEWDEIDFQKEVERLSPMCAVRQAEDGLVVEITHN
ncbi:MAG: ribonuclease Z [Acidobacteria bacterium]|nr:ribonuclease Z [Acidobacteriota bacterium]